MTRARENRIPVACADCPHCGKENILARVASARSGFNATQEHRVRCKQCHRVFALPEYSVQIRRHPREIVDAEYGLAALPWFE